MTNISVFEILEQLSSNNSRNFKIDLLKKNSDNAILKQAVILALNPFINFYQRKIPDYIPSENPKICSLDLAFSKLYMLCNREVTGNLAIEFLKDLLSSLSFQDAKVLERIVLKDLKCGVSTSTVNSVWPNLIPEYPVMLCSQYSEKLIEKIKFPAMVQVKMDGMRFNAIVIDNKCEFRSRNGKEIELLGYLKEEFVSLANGRDLVFDGELLVESSNNQVENRQTGNGILNKCIKGTISDKEASLIFSTIWDVIPYNKFSSGIDNTPYSERYNTLQSLDFPENEKIKLIEFSLVNSYDSAQKLFHMYLDKGMEGIILKDLNKGWENKRVNHQIKFKGELDCDLKIVGIEEGTGKYQGMMGAIICESEDGKIKVSIGSGFSDSERKEFFDNKIIGKIISVQYNSRIQNKNGSESLFLPIFLEIRYDKTSADLEKSIK
jgi:ATP-dependent DNA ligase